MNKCLVLVDLQNDYFPGGKMELAGIEAAAENAQLLLTEFRKTKAPIIHVQHISLPPNAFFFLSGTNGAKINKRVTPQRGRNSRPKKLSKQLPGYVFIGNIGTYSYGCVIVFLR